MSSNDERSGPVIASDDPILDPRGEVTVETNRITDRLAELSGKTIGFLDNAKTNADVFLDEIATVLTEEFGVEETIHRRKSNTAIPADSIAAYLHEHCDAIVNAYGDCGSCTSWCVYDSVDLERKGTPVATVNSEEFVRLGQSEARSLGLPGLPLITVPHPMGDVSEAVARDRARTAVPEVVRVLTTSRDALAEEFEGKYLGENEELQDEELYCPI